MPISGNSSKIFNYLGNFFIIIGIALLTGAYGPVIYDEAWYWLKTVRGQQLSLQNEPGSVPDSVFARLLEDKTINLKPVNKDFSIVIEKL